MGVNLVELQRSCHRLCLRTELATASAPIANLLAGLSADGSSPRSAGHQKPLPSLGVDKATEDEQVNELVERAMLGDFDSPVLSSADLDDCEEFQAPMERMQDGSVVATCGSVISAAMQRSGTGATSALADSAPPPASSAERPAADARDFVPPASRADRPAARAQEAASTRAASEADVNPVPAWAEQARSQPEVAAALDLNSKLSVARRLPTEDKRRPLWLAAVAITATQKGLQEVQGVQSVV